MVCCLCCKSGPIRAQVRVPRAGFVPGERIPVYGDVENLSNRNMKQSAAVLVQEVQYHATSKTRRLYNVLNTVQKGPIPPGGHDTWNGETLAVPPIPPSYMQFCKIIDIHYFVILNVEPAGPALTLATPVEVTIGSIPLRSVVQANPPLAPPPPLQAPSDPSSAQLYGAGPSVFSLPPPPSMPANVPPPSYSESVFGRQEVRDADDNHDIGNYNSFAPVYTYYNWNNK